MNKRQNPLKLSEKELNQIVLYIKQRFGEEWFNKNQDHILVSLYNRTDFLATNELVTLSKSLKIMDNIDKGWVDGRIKEIKSKNSNNSRGYCFEIIGLAMLAQGINYKLIPCTGNNPGTDGKLLFDDGLCMELSMKNYAMSKHQEFFLKQSGELYEIYLSLLKGKNICSKKFMRMCIVFNEYISDMTTWRFLKENLNNLIFNNKYRMPKEFETKMYIEISGTRLEENMNSKFSNHTFMIISPYHKNEKKNLYDKINDAIANLKKHMKPGEKNIYGLFIRVDINVSIDICEKWIEEYFEQNDVLIQLVVLYQPGTARSLEKNSTITTMNFKIILNNGDIWILKHPSDLPQFEIQVGELVTETPSMMMINSGTNQKIKLEETYVFQKGEMFYNALPNNENGWDGSVSSPAPGIKISSVFEKDGKCIVLTMINADSEELKII